MWATDIHQNYFDLCDEILYLLFVIQNYTNIDFRKVWYFKDGFTCGNDFVDKLSQKYYLLTAIKLLTHLDYSDKWFHYKLKALMKCCDPVEYAIKQEMAVLVI
jgi:hypothetical protein